MKAVSHYLNFLSVWLLQCGCWYYFFCKLGYRLLNSHSFEFLITYFLFLYECFLISCFTVGRSSYRLFWKTSIHSDTLMLPSYFTRLQSSQMSFSIMSSLSGQSFHADHFVVLITESPQSHISWLSFFICTALWFLIARSSWSQMS